jgi:multidrug resistance efflux pump
MALSRKKGIFAVLFLAVVVVIGGGGWYLYNQITYVSTDNASIQGSNLKGSIVPLTSPDYGTLEDWQIYEGKTVSQGQVIGHINDLMGSMDVRAPITGTILENDAVTNEMVLPGQSLGYMVDLNKLQVVANIDETEIYKVKVGQAVDISVDAFPGVRFKGKVTRIGTATAVIVEGIPNTSLSGVFDKVTQRVPVYISIAGTHGEHLVPGMSATVDIHRR